MIMSFIKRVAQKIASLFAKSIDSAKSAKEAVLPPKDKERTNPGEIGGVQLWYPGAIITDFEMKTGGFYKDKYPKGAVVHFTSGWCRDEKDAINSMRGGYKSGYAFFMIGPTGQVYQSHPLDKWGSHAGESNWPGLGYNVSSKLVGIEIACAGKVKSYSNGQFKSWFGWTAPEGSVRSCEETDTVEKGFYHKYTEAQEASLVDLLVWLYLNNPLVFNIDYILGHCEVSGKRGLGYFRKNDPGGSLSMTLDDLRGLVKNKVMEKLKAK